MSKIGKPKQLPPVGHGAEGELTSAIEAGAGRLAELRILRRIVASHLEHPNTLARDLAALARRYQDLTKEIEELETLEETLGAEAREAGYVEDVPFDPQAL
ncbi:hypothetical protein [Rothia sp. P3C3.S176]|uniref:hypothetical protein n=1 Tax=Rothia sp. P3C3.S176 TaxID=2962204 RepID=UPI0020C845B2|nr:hypothetical protein [Rothia sp. P3C3.S176]MCP8995028.1 hypothetical protein [Rothia sp. P3C3.S176]